jgi:hypothetical protein
MRDLQQRGTSLEDLFFELTSDAEADGAQA